MTESFLSGGAVVVLIGIMLKVHYSQTQKKVDSLNGTYVRRDVCHERVDGMREDIKEIKKDVKELLKINGGG